MYNNKIDPHSQWQWSISWSKWPVVLFFANSRTQDDKFKQEINSLEGPGQLRESPRSSENWLKFHTILSPAPLQKWHREGKAHVSSFNGSAVTGYIQAALRNPPQSHPRGWHSLCSPSQRPSVLDGRSYVSAAPRSWKTSATLSRESGFPVIPTPSLLSLLGCSPVPCRCI